MLDCLVFDPGSGGWEPFDGTGPAFRGELTLSDRNVQSGPGSRSWSETSWARTAVLSLSATMREGSSVALVSFFLPRVTVVVIAGLSEPWLVIGRQGCFPNPLGALTALAEAETRLVTVPGHGRAARMSYLWMLTGADTSTRTAR